MADATPTLGMALPVVARPECRGRRPRGVQRMGRAGAPTGLIKAGVTPGQARGEGAVDLVDHGRRLTAWAWSPPCTIT